jgi:ribosomal protein S18 acetylase RimI-like enzyme
LTPVKEHASAPGLAVVRRFEAAGFRAWPAATAHYDGTWLIRLTAGHAAKRLNSVNPLDPGDSRDIAERIAKARRRFEAYGRPLTFRLSPLAGRDLSDHLDGEGWSSFDESLVMSAPIEGFEASEPVQLLPVRDVGQFVGAAIGVQGLDASVRPGLTEVIGAIRPETGLFVARAGNVAIATAICVRDGELAGLFEVASAAGERRQGHGRHIVTSAIAWARLKGARKAWLQVEAANDAATSLYRSLGFREVYRYVYRRPAGEATT